MSLPLVLIPVLSGLVAQALKPLLNKRFYSTLVIAGRRIPRYGGMPSAHTAFATSLATVVFLIDGIGSVTFAITAALVIFILDDALRMRMFLGRFGEALHLLVAKLPPEEQEKYPYLEARLGHTVPEVTAGAALGMAVTLAALLLLRVL